MLCRVDIALFVAAAMTSTAFAADPDHRDRFVPAVFQDTAGNKLPYQMLSPAKLDAAAKYPLVIFLHGAGERGSDNKKQLDHGMNDFASDEIMAKYPAFVIAPQCPDRQSWVDVDWGAESHTMPEKPSPSLAGVFELIDTLTKTKPIDAKRIYITGLSMGGYGTWDAIQRRPELFTAAIPICGGGDPLMAKQIQFVPLWVFHGDQDRAVKVERSRQMVKAIKDVGTDVKYTEYKGVGHDSWTQTYKDPAVHEWLFAQRKK